MIEWTKEVLPGLVDTTLHKARVPGNDTDLEFDVTILQIYSEGGDQTIYFVQATETHQGVTTTQTLADFFKYEWEAAKNIHDAVKARLLDIGFDLKYLD